MTCFFFFINPTTTIKYHNMVVFRRTLVQTVHNGIAISVGLLHMVVEDTTLAEPIFQKHRFADRSELIYNKARKNTCVTPIVLRFSLSTPLRLRWALSSRSRFDNTSISYHFALSTSSSPPFLSKLGIRYGRSHPSVTWRIRDPFASPNLVSIHSSLSSSAGWIEFLPLPKIQFSSIFFVQVHGTTVVIRPIEVPINYGGRRWDYHDTLLRTKLRKN